MHRISISILFFTLLFLISIKANDTINWQYRGSNNESEIIREYLAPVKVTQLGKSPKQHIKNLEKLLYLGTGQADLNNSELIVLQSTHAIHPEFLLDFGKEIQGGIRIVTARSKSKQPIKVRITFGESISEAMSKVENSTATNDHAMRDYTLELPWLGKIETGNTGFRFVRIQLTDTNRTLRIKEINAIAKYRDIPYLGSFKCNDSLLNTIWETGAYTVHLNMQEYLWDGVKRDRLVWVGDMHPEVMTILSVFGYNDVVPASLDFIKQITPLPDYMNGISSYSMWWILIHYQWYMNAGDKLYLEQNKEYIFSLLKVLASKIDTTGSEILDGNRFLDWPTSPNKKAIHAGLQSLMLMTFNAGAEIAAYLTMPDERKFCIHTMNQLKKYIPDPNANKSAAALLAISGLKNATEVNNTILSKNALSGISSFYGYYVLQARALAGDYQGAIDVIRNYWGGMIKLGATTFWEDFDLSWAENAARIDEFSTADKTDVHATYGAYCYKGLRHSLCHGWASGPTAWMTQHILGIKALEPGCEKILIDPHLGDLEWAEGTFPTPYGVIKVSHIKTTEGNIKTKVDSPKEIEIVVK